MVQPDGRAVSYSYGPSGQLLALTTPDGTTTYTPDAAGRLAALTDPDGGQVAYTYDAAGQVIQVTRPDGTTETRTYDALGDVTRVLTRHGGVMLSDLTYEYDLLGRLTAMTEAGVARTEYTYDPLGRLLGETRTPVGGPTETIRYAYDPAGNRTRMATAAGTADYAYNADGELTGTSGAAPVAYAYDAAGRLVLRDGGPADRTVYTWNAENRLVRTDSTGPAGTSTTTRVYDFAGTLVGETVDGVETRYLTTADPTLPAVVEEYTPGGDTVASYTYGSGLESRKTTAGRLYYHADAAGNVRYLTDAAGHVAGTDSFTAYGVSTDAGGIAQPYGFGAERSDPRTGLIYLRARYYDPSTGRFLSPDPFPGHTDSPISRQKYPYADDAPTNASDPTGREPESLGEFLAANTIQNILLAAAAQSVIGALASIKGMNGWDGPNYFASPGSSFFGLGTYTTKPNNPNAHGLRSRILTFAAGESFGTNAFTTWLTNQVNTRKSISPIQGAGLASLLDLGIFNLVGFNLVVSSETLVTPGLFGTGLGAAGAVLGAYVAYNFNISAGPLALPAFVSAGVKSIVSGDVYNAGGAQVSLEGFSFGYSVPNTQSDLQPGISLSLSVGASAGWLAEVNQPDNSQPGG